VKTNTNAATKDLETNAGHSLHNAIDQATASAHKAIDRAMSVADSAAGWLSERGEGVKTAPSKLMSTSCDYVSAHPFKALGIALVAGVLLSKLAS